jgi:hypothetical protein
VYDTTSHNAMTTARNSAQLVHDECSKTWDFDVHTAVRTNSKPHSGLPVFTLDPPLYG